MCHALQVTPRMYSRVPNYTGGGDIPIFGFFWLNFENLNRYKMNSVEVKVKFYFHCCYLT